MLFQRHQLDEIASTNDEIKRDIYTHGDVVLAKRQTAGKGRSNRQWFSDEGNLFFSIKLISTASLSDISQLVFVASLSLQQALQKQSIQSSIKWPNDLIMNHKKVAGMLLETVQKGNKREAIIGIGVNTISFPDVTDHFKATSLKEEGAQLTNDNILEAFLNEFENHYKTWEKGNFVDIRNDYLKHAYKRHEAIVARTKKGSHEGIYKTIDDNGSLVLIDEHGIEHYIASADIF